LTTVLSAPAEYSPKVAVGNSIDALARAEREGSLRQKIRFYGRFALLIVDEIGYQPVVE
jgi:DNA replication protein DnaC